MSLIVGGSGPDVLEGTDLDDQIQGLGGADELYGRGGDDTLDGGSGTDLLVGGDGNDTLTNLDGGTFEGGLGFDRLVFSFSDIFMGTDGDNAYVPFVFDGSTGSGSVAGVTFSSIESFDIVGSQSSPNTLTGGGGGDRLTGGDGLDTLIGGDGDDVLAGGLDQDVLNGGNGVDTATYVDAVYTGVSLDLVGGYANVDGSNDTLIDIENVVGSAFNDVIVGDDGANRLDGGAGDDQINGGGGEDTLIGGDGNDLLRGAGASFYPYIQATLDGGAGTDLVAYDNRGYQLVVNLATGTTLGGGFKDNLFNIEDVLGTTLNDTLTGDAGANRLDGYLGDDTLDGGGGNDALYGGGGRDMASFANEAAGVAVDLAAGTANGATSGSDVLIGFTDLTLSDHDDQAYGDAAANRIIGGGGDDHIDGRAGDDLLSGSDGDDVVVGGEGNDQLSGGGGDDVLMGGAGDDQLYGGYGHDILMGGAGNDYFDDDGGDDVVSYKDATSAVTVSTVIYGAQDTGGGGIDTLSRISSLEGSDFNDVLTGAVVSGGKGDDVLNALGWGTALYADATSGVTVNLTVEGPQNTGGAGVDTLNGVASLTGSSFGDTLTGNGSDNRLTGGLGDDTLEGGEGSDVLKGGGGTDILHGGGGVDLADYQDATSGLDIQMVFTTAQNTLGGGIDTLVGIENIQGSSFSDVLTGDSGANKLGGGAGDDILKGGDGDDTLHGGMLNGAPDYTFVSGNDVLEGGSGNDTLYGEGYVGGTDTLRGGVGDDVVVSENQVLAVYGDDGADTFLLINGQRSGVIDGGAGSDTLQALSVDISAATLSGVETLKSGGVTATAEQFTAFTRIESFFLGGIANLTLANGGVVDFSKNAVGAVSVIGSAGADDITGTTGADTLHAGAGADILHGGLGADTLYAGLGEDQLFGGAGDDFLGLASNFSDTPDTGVDRYWGEDGSDTFSIGSSDGTIALDGGADNDLFYLAGGLVGTVEGGSGADVISSSDIRNLTITGVERLNGGTTATAAQFAGFTTIAGYNGPGAITDLVLATAGTVDFSLNVLAGSWISVTGSSGADKIIGTDGADTLNGANGEDTLDGGAGADTLNGAAGYDVANYASAKSGVSVNLATAGQQNTGGAGVDTLISIEGLVGSAFNDALYAGAVRAIMEGGAGDDQMYGGAGDDLLLGGLGNDHLYGSAGADILNGADGFDFVRYDLSAAGVSIDLAGGIAGGGDAQGDSLIDVEAVVGTTFADAIYGNNADNVFYGQGGADALSGGNGADTLDGGDGDDSLNGGAGDDLLNGGGGYDVASYASAKSGVVVNLATAGAQDTGGGGVDTLIGIEGLTGSAYNDVLRLSTGLGEVRTALEGGAGDDQLYGGTGPDRLLGGLGGDHLYGSVGADILDGGADFDFARYDFSSAGVSIDLGSNASGGDAQGDSLIAIEGIVGTAFGDVVFGRTGDNIFYGQGGADVLRGEAGNDILDGGDGDDNLRGGTGNDVLRGGAGFDVAGYDDLTSGAVVNLTTGVNSGSASGDVLTGVEGLQGSGYSDTFTGDTGANSLYGMNGDDVLRGMAGDDVLDGGQGSDHLYGGAGADVLRGGTFVDLARYDDAAGGVWVDLAQGKGFTGDAAGDTLSGIEGLVGSIHADTLVGDGDINTLYGLGGDDLLQGGAGVDTLEGGGGNDHLYGGTGGDILQGGDGVDLARYDTSATGVWVDLNQGVGLAGEATGDTFNAIEGVVGSTSADTLIGNAGGNTFYGQAGNDTLNAGVGADTLFGGTGADTFVYDEIADSTAAQTDRLWDFSLADQDRIDLSAIDANTATGQDDAFSLVGALTGQAGQAVLTYDQAQDATNLILDVNGDGLVDFMLTINGHLTTAEGLIL